MKVDRRPLATSAVRYGQHFGFLGMYIYKIGPLFANEPEIADDLLCALAADATGPLYLDIPAPNSAGGALAARHDMTPVFTTIRMYDGSPPPLDLDRIFGVTSLELG